MVLLSSLSEFIAFCPLQWQRRETHRVLREEQSVLTHISALPQEHRDDVQRNSPALGSHSSVPYPPTETFTPTPTPSSTPTASFTPTSTASPTLTMTPTASATPSQTFTPTATASPTPSPTPDVPPFTGATFVCHGDGNRVAQTLNGVTTYFIGGYYEYNQTSNQVTKYYFAGTTRVAMRKYTIPQSMSVEYLLGDHLGSTSITTDANGARVSELRYKPWGEVRYSWTSGPSTTPTYELTRYTYTGQYSDSYINLLWYGSRHYDPALGRFTSPDSIVPTATQGVQAWDRFAYTNNNPVRYTDPTGHGVDCGIGDPGCKAGKMDPKIQLFEYNHWLIGQVQNRKMNDREAFSLLVKRAASLTPNCTECFVNNLGAVLTGHSKGHPARDEINAQLGLAERDPLYKTRRDDQLDQSGFDPIFQDPYIAPGGNPQPHHFWFYVQVGFESGGFIGDTGVLLHETVLSRSRSGNSSQDQYLGYEGVDLGQALAAGTINLSEVGDYINRVLAPGSENAEKWRLVDAVGQTDVNVESAP